MRNYYSYVYTIKTKIWVVHIQTEDTNVMIMNEHEIKDKTGEK